MFFRCSRFAFPMGLFLSRDAFAQEALAGESSGAIQMVIDVLNAGLSAITNFLSSIIFFDFGLGIPLVIIVLVGGGIYYSFYFRWISLRGIKHSIDVIRGGYDNPDHPGEISHFKALTSALSATVGQGNIAGVAIAVSAGGPGAVFWMIVTAFFGMASKFVSCTLSVMYRRIHPDGRVSGGPMYYLEQGLKEKGLGVLGRVMAVIFAVLTVGGSLGIGNMFQVNQTVEMLGTVSEGFKTYNWVVGLLMAGVVGVVISGGIKRIGTVTAGIVPFMCGLYVLTSFLIILARITELPNLIVNIISQAFIPEAMYGGFMGALVQGIRRAAFSNEAGLGSAAFAHAAAKTDEPVRQGIVAMIGPFIDTVIICLMTALVCMITGAYLLPEFQGQSGYLVGIQMTSVAFDSFAPGSRYVIAVVAMFFAYTTVIAWAYYGERAWEYLFGLRSTLTYRIVFVCFVFIGSVTALKSVVDFSDAMIFAMAFPNIIGCIIMSPQIKDRLKEYWGRYKAGEIEAYQRDAY